MSDDAQKDATRKVSADALEEIRRTAAKAKAIEPPTQRASAADLRALGGEFGLSEATSPAGLAEVTMPGSDELDAAQLQESMLHAMADFDPSAEIEPEPQGEVPDEEPVEAQPVLADEAKVETAQPSDPEPQTAPEPVVVAREEASEPVPTISSAMAGSLAGETEPEAQPAMEPGGTSILPILLTILVLAALAAFTVMVVMDV